MSLVKPLFNPICTGVAPCVDYHGLNDLGDRDDCAIYGVEINQLERRLDNGDFPREVDL